MIAYILGITAGIAATTQASVNTDIRNRIKSPYITTAINFCMAILIMMIIILLTEGNLYIPFAEIARRPLWIWSGGVCGAIIIMMGILCLPVLGSALNMMLACTSQIIIGLIIDQLGLFGSQQIDTTLPRAAGAVLVLAGIILAAIEKSAAGDEGKIRENKDDGNNRDNKGDGNNRDNKGDGSSRTGNSNKNRIALYSVLALLNGTAAGIQIAVNGSLGSVIGSAPKATLISVSVGLCSMLTVMLVLSLTKGRGAIYVTDNPPKFRLSPMMMLAGLFPVIIVGGNAISAPMIGAGLVNILNLTGMMISSLIVDATGFLGIEKKPVTARKVAGMVLIIAGSALISLL